MRALRPGRARAAVVVQAHAHALVARLVARDRLGQRRPAGPGRGSAPCSARSAGRAKSTKVTSAETGLPGRPKTSVPPRARRAEPRRLARAQRDAPEALLHARRAERRLDVVVRADGDAAGEQHDVRRLQRPGDRRPGRRAIVGDVLDEDDVGALLGGQGREDGGVRVVDLARSQRQARRDELVAGAQDGDAGAAGDAQLHGTGVGGDAERRRREDRAGVQDRRALRHVVARAADVAARGDGLAQHDLAVRLVAELDLQHAVRAVGQRRAGGDPHRLAFAHRGVVGRARARLSGEPQAAPGRARRSPRSRPSRCCRRAAWGGARPRPAPARDPAHRRAVRPARRAAAPLRAPRFGLLRSTAPGHLAVAKRFAGGSGKNPAAGGSRVQSGLRRCDALGRGRLRPPSRPAPAGRRHAAARCGGDGPCLGSGARQRPPAGARRGPRPRSPRHRGSRGLRRARARARQRPGAHRSRVPGRGPRAAHGRARAVRRRRGGRGAAPRRGGHAAARRPGGGRCGRGPARALLRRARRVGR